MGIGGGAVLFFADDGDGLAGEFDRGRFFDVFALGNGVFGSAAAFVRAGPSSSFHQSRVE